MSVPPPNGAASGDNSPISRGDVPAVDQKLALGYAERAVALDPNNANTYANQALVLNSVGKPEEALRAVKQESG